MIEVVGDIWDVSADALIIPTNGYVRKDGRNVMGAGLAKDAARRDPQLPAVLGQHLSAKGNHVHVLRLPIVSFPVKDVWWRKALVPLIRRSCNELVALADEYEWQVVALPRVGCGVDTGGLDWLHDVKPVLERRLDERFMVVSLARDMES